MKFYKALEQRSASLGRQLCIERSLGYAQLQKESLEQNKTS